MGKLFPASLWGAVAFVLLTIAVLQTPATKPPSFRQLKILSFNVQFLPGIARSLNKRREPEYRAQKIGEICRNYDVVGVNELFDNGPRDTLLKSLKEQNPNEFTSILPPEEAKSRFGIGSGLAILTRLPKVENNYLRFGNDSIRKNGLFSDGYAAKGAMHARLAFDKYNPEGESLDLFVTHLESRVVVVRFEQYKLLADFMAKHSSSQRPLILLGDLNTNGEIEEMRDEKSHYNSMLKIFRESLPNHTFADAWPGLGKGPEGTDTPDEEDGGERIDFILIANPKQSAASKLRPVSIQVNRFLDERVKSLSDHSGVEAVVEWATKP